MKCSESLPIEPSWMELRGELVDREKRMTIPAFDMMSVTSLKDGDIWVAYRKDRDKWLPKELREKHGPSHRLETAYFAGCTASYIENDIAMATVRLMDATGIDFTYLGQAENCCGIPMLVAGMWDMFAEIMRRNMSAMDKAGVKTVVTSCTSCHMSWSVYDPQWAAKLRLDYHFEIKHYSELLAEKIGSGEFVFPAFKPVGARSLSTIRATSATPPDYTTRLEIS